MFQSDKPLPPPPSGRTRNESLASSLSSYRSRPTPASPSSNNNSESSGFSFSNTKSLFENFNRPQVRSAISSIAKNPTVQKAALNAAKDERVRNAAINAAKKPENQAAAYSFAQSSTGKNTILSLAKQFENKPLMGLKTSKNVSASFENTQHTIDDVPEFKSKTQVREQLYPSLTGDGSHFRNSKITTNSEYPSLYQERPRSTDPDITNIIDELFPVNTTTKHVAPARPPPPKLGSRSIPNISGIGKSDIDIIDPHGIVKYPYKTDKYDELNCDSGDTILLKKEIDENWIYGTNTRTGHSGIVPINFLHIKIPLAPVSNTNITSRVSNSLTIPDLFNTNSWNDVNTTGSTSYISTGSELSNSFTSYTSSTNSNKCFAKALYDYNTGVEGDLIFKVGDIITVLERVNDEWLRGEINYQTGIFPVNYVDVQDLNKIQRKGMTGDALTDSFSKLSYKPKFVTALYNYCTGITEDLVFEAGDVIQILEEINDEWIKGSIDGRTGLVPLTYVERNE